MRNGRGNTHVPADAFPSRGQHTHTHTHTQKRASLQEKKEKGKEPFSSPKKSTINPSLRLCARTGPIGRQVNEVDARKGPSCVSEFLLSFSFLIFSSSSRGRRVVRGKTTSTPGVLMKTLSCQRPKSERRGRPGVNSQSYINVRFSCFLDSFLFSFTSDAFPIPLSTFSNKKSVIASSAKRMECNRFDRVHHPIARIK